MPGAYRFANGRGQIVTLIGEAGLGKSRLVEELHGCVGQMKVERMFWIESRGISYVSTHPYGLFQQHMRQVHDLSADDPPEEIHRKFAETFPWLEAGQLEAIVSTARLLLEVGASGDTGGPLLEGEAVRRQIFEAEEGVFTMMPIIAPGQSLKINAVTLRTGWVKVEVVGIDSRRFSECVPIVGDQHWTRVTWKGGNDFGIPEGQPMTLRIEMKQAKLFGLEFD